MNRELSPLSIQVHLPTSLLLQIDRTERERLFSNFYELGDSNLQNAYLRGLIEKEDTDGLKRQRFSYFVSTKELMRVEVCHQC